MAEISVIIPTYNSVSYLAEAIQSVCSQTFTDWELVVVDDGSTDNTLQVLADFQDSRISIIQQVNKGVSAARNTGIYNSSAPLVTFLDADDTLMPDQMSVLYRYLDTHPEVGLVAGKMRKIDSSGRIYIEKRSAPANLAFPELLVENAIPIGSMMVRREWLERVRGFDESMCSNEDWDLWLRLVIDGCQLSQVEKIVMTYRIHSEQVTGNATKMRTDTLGLWKKFFNLPNLPTNVSDYRGLAVAAALVRTSARAFRSGDFGTGNNDLLEAINLNPSLSNAGYRKLTALLRGWAADLQVQDPETYLIAISKHLPLSLFALRCQLRKTTSAMMLEPFFGASRDIWRSQRRVLFKAISYDPLWLANRGVVRMIMDSWITIPSKRKR